MNTHNQPDTVNSQDAEGEGMAIAKKILFSESHDELLTSESAGFSLLFEQLQKIYRVDFAKEALVQDQLEKTDLLVLGAPHDDFAKSEIDAIGEFVARGGGLLLLSNADAAFNPPYGLHKLMELAGLRIQEYLNYPPTSLRIFQPHFITANVKKIRVGKLAHLSIDEENENARPLAFTKAPRQPIIACTQTGAGRMIVMGDTELFSDGLLNQDDNRILAANLFSWLAASNVIDIESIIIPSAVTWGKSKTVELRVKNSNRNTRPYVKCILESDAGAFIEQSVQEIQEAPPGKSSLKQWAVHPKRLGAQELRLAVHVDEHTKLYFDPLPEMRCLAPGYLNMAVKNRNGELCTTFQTGDRFIVEGFFHWTTDAEPLPHKLLLTLEEGLVKRGKKSAGDHVIRWDVQATAQGTPELLLNLLDVNSAVNHSLPTRITVRSSKDDQFAEIQAAYVKPLDAEIAARLERIDPRLADDRIKRQPFNIVGLEKYIDKVYTGETALWLWNILDSADREQWYNPDLLDRVLAYIMPTYQPGKGTFIPCDPDLASQLVSLHQEDEKQIEYHLLYTRETDGINIKQNIAAYLLHEKYGHGFFYTQTRLGRQMTVLYHYNPGEYKNVMPLIKDSVIVVNEGFAAWMELYFLSKLDRETKQAVYPRRISLIRNSKYFKEYKEDSRFFENYPPVYDSPYREGYEYMDFISKNFSVHCALRIFLMATNVDLGVSEMSGGIQLRYDEEQIEKRLFDDDKDHCRSHQRLKEATDLLYQYRKTAKEMVKDKYCAADCHQKCPLEEFIAKKIGMEQSEIK